MQIFNNRKMRKAQHRRQVATRNQAGVAMLEVLIAILIFSMGILALVGLQAEMIKNTSDNKYRSDAAFLAQRIFGQAWGFSSDSKGDSGVKSANLVCPDRVTDILPAGKCSIVIGDKGLVTVSFTWQVPGTTQQHRYNASTYIGAL